MKKNCKKYSGVRGFTLIEVLIYIVLFGLLMSGAVVSAFQLLQSGQHQDLNFAAQQEGNFVDRKLAWVLSSASAVSVSGGNVMTVTRSDLGAQSPLVVDASGGTMARITLARHGAAAQPITADGLVVSDVLFAVTPPAGGLPEAVHASFSLAGKAFSYAMYLRQ